MVQTKEEFLSILFSDFSFSFMLNNIYHKSVCAYHKNTDEQFYQLDDYITGS